MTLTEVNNFKRFVPQAIFDFLVYDKYAVLLFEQIKQLYTNKHCSVQLPFSHILRQKAITNFLKTTYLHMQLILQIKLYCF